MALGLGSLILLVALDLLFHVPHAPSLVALVVRGSPHRAMAAMAALASTLPSCHWCGCCTWPTLDPDTSGVALCRRVGLVASRSRVHALTVGAIGGLIIGMMTRTARGIPAGRCAPMLDVACYGPSRSQPCCGFRCRSFAPARAVHAVSVQPALVFGLRPVLAPLLAGPDPARSTAHPAERELRHPQGDPRRSGRALVLRLLRTRARRPCRSALGTQPGGADAAARRRYGPAPPDDWFDATVRAAALRFPIRSRSVRRSPRHHPPRCRGTSRSTPASSAPSSNCTARNYWHAGSLSTPATRQAIDQRRHSHRHDNPRRPPSEELALLALLVGFGESEPGTRHLSRKPSKSAGMPPSQSGKIRTRCWVRRIACCTASRPAGTLGGPNRPCYAGSGSRARRRRRARRRVPPPKRRSRKRPRAHGRSVVLRCRDGPGRGEFACSPSKRKGVGR